MKLRQLFTTAHDARQPVVEDKNSGAVHSVNEAIAESHNESGRTADMLEVGDLVIIAGAVQYKDSVGEIRSFGEGKKFVTVELFGGKGVHSFASSDVSEFAQKTPGYKDEDDEEDEEEVNEFYVAFGSERGKGWTSWVGRVTRQFGGKWTEKPALGEPDYRWGQKYMSYLSPDDVMTWINKDYDRSYEIEGPFDTLKQAEKFATRNFGPIDADDE